LGGIPKNRRVRCTRGNLLEQLQPFSAEAKFHVCKTGGIAARPRKAFDNAAADRVDNMREHNRHGPSCLGQRHHGGSASGQDDVWCERAELNRLSTNLSGIGCGPAGFDADVTPDVPS
jgi:hypothetical protein